MIDPILGGWANQQLALIEVREKKLQIVMAKETLKTRASLEQYCNLLYGLADVLWPIRPSDLTEEKLLNEINPTNQESE